MASDIMNLIHTVLVKRYPELQANHDVTRVDSDIIVQGVFCGLDIYDDAKGYDWRVTEGCDPLKWPDGPGSSDFLDNHRVLAAGKFDPANPGWDLEVAIDQVVFAFRTCSAEESICWYQRRIEELNLVTKNLETLKTQTTKKPDHLNDQP